jgi:hypothetical protein
VRFSTYRVSGDGAAGAEGVGVWHGERLHPVPGVTRLTDLLGDDGSRLRAAGQAALSKPGLGRPDVELLAPVPAPPSVRDFMAFRADRDPRPAGVCGRPGTVISCVVSARAAVGTRAPSYEEIAD